jgi:hypothetical protein
MSQGHLETLAEVEEMSSTEGRRMLGGLVRDELGISLDEFLMRLDHGDYDHVEHEGLLRLVMLAPFAR